MDDARTNDALLRLSALIGADKADLVASKARALAMELCTAASAGPLLCAASEVALDGVHKTDMVISKLGHYCDFKSMLDAIRLRAEVLFASVWFDKFPRICDFPRYLVTGYPAAGGSTWCCVAIIVPDHGVFVVQYEFRSSHLLPGVAGTDIGMLTVALSRLFADAYRNRLVLHRRFRNARGLPDELDGPLILAGKLAAAGALPAGAGCLAMALIHGYDIGAISMMDPKPDNSPDFDQVIAQCTSLISCTSRRPDDTDGVLLMARGCDVNQPSANYFGMMAVYPMDFIGHIAIAPGGAATVVNVKNGATAVAHLGNNARMLAEAFSAVTMLWAAARISCGRNGAN